jgi:hypothetical protein
LSGTARGLVDKALIRTSLVVWESAMAVVSLRQHAEVRGLPDLLERAVGDALDIGPSWTIEYLTSELRRIFL